MALATISSALSSVVGPMRRFAWRAATAPTIMLAIQPMPTRRWIRVNMFVPPWRALGPLVLGPLRVLPPGWIDLSADRRQQMFRFEAEHVARPRAVIRDLAAGQRAPDDGCRMEARQQVRGV